MISIISKPDTQKKLEILSSDSRYDLACACGSNNSERRKRSADGKWIYPVALPNGGTSILFKTLLSNVCNNDCAYCPLRENQDVRRCSLSIEEAVKAFMGYYERREVMGLFLSSGVIGDPEITMDRLCGVAEHLRKKEKFRGFIHLKIIPGCSDAAIEKAVGLASAVSLNIETPGEKYLSRLTSKKDYIKDIIRPIKLISKLTAKGNKFSRVKQTTQFIVGAAGEADSEIVKYMWGLYKRLNLQRVYFSAYQDNLGDRKLNTIENDSNGMFVREHRLYQADFLIRKYGFSENDILYDENGRLSLDVDPKQAWVNRHPEKFPVNINTADKSELLRVPGFGPLTVNRILKKRMYERLYSISDVGKAGIRLKKANKYLSF